MKKGEKNPESILVVGVGNILLGDEGIGVHTIKELQKLKLPDNVEILDMGVATFPLISYVAGRKKVIIVDAVKGGGEAGDIYRLSLDELRECKERFFSVHEMGIADILDILELEYRGISGEVVIIGVEPGEIKWGIGLSPALSEKLPAIIECILREIYK